MLEKVLAVLQSRGYGGMPPVDPETLHLYARQFLLQRKTQLAPEESAELALINEQLTGTKSA